MKCTGSISKGHAANLHNSRVIYKDADHTPAHIDPDRVKEDVFLVNLQLKEVYERVFGDALRDYNERQVAKRHPERQIADYLKKVEGDKQLKPMYEFVIQVGNKDERPERNVACEIYEEWLADFQKRYGANFAVAQAIIHNDEATPHLHLEIVPTAHSKRGLAVQNSLTKAIKQAGHVDYKDMLATWDTLLTARMEAHGIERVAGDKERQMGGVDIHTYKRTMAALAETRGEVEKAREELTEVTAAAEKKADDVRQLQAVWYGAKDLVADLDKQVAEKTAERDAVSVQIDQMTSKQGEERGKLTALQGEVAKKQALAADLSSQILEKTAEKVRISAEVADFSEKREAAEQRLESVRQDVREVESIAQAGLPELAKRAASAGDGERESAARSRNQELRAALAALESEGGELEGRVRSLEKERRGLEDENRGLRGRLAGLERRLDDLWTRLVAAAERAKDFIFEQVEGLKWVFDELGLESYEGMRPLADRDYSFDSEMADAIGAASELGRGWEPSAPTFHYGR